MDDIYNLEINNTTTVDDIIDKFEEEVQEVHEALKQNDKMNLIEELIDVVQCCYSVAHVHGVDLKDYICMHNAKMLTRGHKFIKRPID